MFTKRDITLAVFFGLLIPAVLIVLESMGMKWMLAGLFALLAFFLIAPWPDKEQIILLLFAGFLCVNLDKNFFVSQHFLHLNTTSAGFSFGLSDILLICLYALWIRRSLKEPQTFDRRLLLFFAVYFILLAIFLLSAVNAQHSILSFYEFKKRLQAIFAIIYLSINIKSSNLLQKVLVMLFLGIIASSSVGVAQYVTGRNLGLSVFGEADDFYNQSIVGSSEVIRRVSGLMQHSNIFGMYLCLLLPIVYSLAFSDIGKKFKYFSFLVSIFGTLGLLLTFSRAAISSFVMGMALLFAFKWKEIFKKHNFIVFYMYGGLFIGLLACFWEKLTGRFLGSPASNLSYRFLLNEAGFKMIEKHPYLGIGLNNFSTQLEFYDTHNVVTRARFPAHNIFVLIAAESGLISLAIFLIFVFMVLFAGFKTYRTSADPIARNFCIGAVCGIIGSLIQGLVDFTLMVQIFYLLFFVICTLILASRYSIKKALYE